MATAVPDIHGHDPTITRQVFYPLIFLASMLWLLHRYQKKSRLYTLGNKLPGPMALPIFGNALLAIGKKPDRKCSLLYLLSILDNFTHKKNATSKLNFIARGGTFSLT